MKRAISLPERSFKAACNNKSWGSTDLSKNSQHCCLGRVLGQVSLSIQFLRFSIRQRESCSDLDEKTNAAGGETIQNRCFKAIPIVVFLATLSSTNNVTNTLHISSCLWSLWQTKCHFLLTSASLANISAFQCVWKYLQSLWSYKGGWFYDCWLVE